MFDYDDNSDKDNDMGAFRESPMFEERGEDKGEDRGQKRKVTMGKGPSTKSLYLTTILFYAGLTGLSFLLASIWDIDPLQSYHLSPVTTVSEVLLAIGTGLAIVATSKVLDKRVAAFRRLSTIFKDMLGEISIPGAFVLAISSGVGEELFFRGFLQQVFETVTFVDCYYGPLLALVCASLLFGLMHQGGDWKIFYPWTLFALVNGFILGGFYLFTGSLLAPILIHFTVNFLNLSAITADSDDANLSE